MNQFIYLLCGHRTNRLEMEQSGAIFINVRRFVLDGERSSDLPVGFVELFDGEWRVDLPVVFDGERRLDLLLESAQESDVFGDRLFDRRNVFKSDRNWRNADGHDFVFIVNTFYKRLILIIIIQPYRYLKAYRHYHSRKNTSRKRLHLEYLRRWYIDH